MSYQATICKIRTQPHPNADKLLIGICANAQVLVGVDTKDGELGVYFPPDGQLSEKFCQENHLLRPEGYLEPNRRVRSIKLRGVQSEGLWLPISCLSGYTYVADWQEGDVMSDILVCSKYETPATKRAREGKVQKVSRETTSFFKKHKDTAQLKTSLHEITEGSVVYITEKLHGTSARYGRVKEPTNKRWWQWWLPKERYEFLVGLRNVILTNNPSGGYYESEEFRTRCVEGLEDDFKDGEIVFGEIVGYTDKDSPIMSPQPIKDAELRKQFGPSMSYTYGCHNGTCKFFIYHIQRVAMNGEIVDLSWQQVKGRARELGFETPPEVDVLHVAYLPDLEQVLLGDAIINGPSLLDSKHIKEGAAFRVERPDGTIKFLKNKSWLFGVLEGYIKDNDDYVDVEESS